MRTTIYGVSRTSMAKMEKTARRPAQLLNKGFQERKLAETIPVMGDGPSNDYFFFFPLGGPVFGGAFSFPFPC